MAKSNDQQKFNILHQARYDWMHMGLQDFKSIGEYNYTLLKITLQLKLCDENITKDQMLEKTFSTFMS
jgi:hypothetical protein